MNFKLGHVYVYVTHWAHAQFEALLNWAAWGAGGSMACGCLLHSFVLCACFAFSWIRRHYSLLLYSLSVWITVEYFIYSSFGNYNWSRIQRHVQYWEFLGFPMLHLFCELHRLPVSSRCNSRSLGCLGAHHWLCPLWPSDPAQPIHSSLSSAGHSPAILHGQWRSALCP